MIPLIVDTGPNSFVAIWPNGSRQPKVLRFEFEGGQSSTWLPSLPSVSALFTAAMGTISWTHVAGDFLVGNTVGAVCNRLGVPPPFQAFLVSAAQLHLLGGGPLVCLQVADKTSRVVYWLFRG